MRKFLFALKAKIYDGDDLMGLFNVRYLPRWMVLFIDISILVFSLFLSFFILQKLETGAIQNIFPYKKYFLVVAINILFMFIFKTYSGIIRHSTFIDLFKIFLSIICTIFLLIVINFIWDFLYHEKLLRLSLILIYFSVSFISLFVFRLVVKESYVLLKELSGNLHKSGILVLGIDEESIALAKAIIGNTSLSFVVDGFLTQRKDSKKAHLLGKKIYTKDELERFPQKPKEIRGVLINKNALSKEELIEWTNLFLEKGLQIYKAPIVEELQGNESKITIQNIQIEDLLNRKPIVIENEEVKGSHFQKQILVTGGAGSIGSEIVRQVAFFKPELVVVLDQAETPLYDIELEMKEYFPEVKFKFILADISNKDRLKSVFEEHQFSIVYHAAAYKHVPLIEENPHEAVLVNIQGSKNLALLASQYQVESFVMVSTDKAVNPTNVMGASKRAAELFVQALQKEEGNKTKFITTRFGNVLGSNGSVIPHFRKQIEKGGPVTITHPDIIRYFMTIPEACELVLQAGTMGKGGEIFVFDMGEPVKIIDLAKRMIKLSGLEPDVDIKIIFTGLRPGEKLYEELLSDKSRTLPTHHQKIMIAKDETIPYEQIETLTEKISSEAKKDNKIQVVKILKEIVKEFKSNNSIFEKLDQ